MFQDYSTYNLHHSTTLTSLDQFLQHRAECSVIQSVRPATDRIIAIGDIHGDFDALVKSLLKSGVVNNRGDWTGGSTVVVQLGDVLDRGGRSSGVDSTNGLEEVQVLYYLYQLNRKAKDAGGAVISLIGNHELMNMLGDFRYASSSHIGGLGGVEARKNLLRPGGRLARKIACNSLGIVKIGDWVFVHGGLLPEHIQSLVDDPTQKTDIAKQTFDKINQLVRGVLQGSVSLNSISPEEEDILFGRDGIFWTRKYSKGIPSSNNCELAYQTMSMLQMNQQTGGIVIGHTPQPNINSQCKNRVWRVDTGMSEAFGGRYSTERIEVLEILGNGKTVRVL
jgi:hypothetical protein